MIYNRVYSATDLDFSIDQIGPREEPRKVLVCTPDYFDIIDVKNVHMEGKTGALNKKMAVEQWDKLKSVYEELSDRSILEEVWTLPGAEGLEDMVFCANQSFPWKQDGELKAVMSKMRHPSRQKEVPFFRMFYEHRGYELIELERSKLFEGMGDTIPHYGKQLLYGGYGHRSDTAAYEEIAEKLQVPVVAMQLVDERFYHLDTCFIPVDEETVFLCPVAFAPEGLQVIKRLFKTVVEIPAEEAEKYFALNAHCINDQLSGNRVAILQEGTTIMKAKLLEHKFEVIEINTSEFMKSGGSVFCMKMMLY